MKVPCLMPIRVKKHKNMRKFEIKTVLVSEKKIWLRYWYLNWTLVLVLDTEFWFWSHTSMFLCHLLFSDRNSWKNSSSYLHCKYIHCPKWIILLCCSFHSCLKFKILLLKKWGENLITVVQNFWTLVTCTFK